MPTLETPPADGWPTLGRQVARWMEANLTFGPGDLRGEPYRLDEEKKYLLRRMYEVYPKGHEREGRRRFKRCALNLRKGSAKTELAAAIAAAELAPDAPVRTVRFLGKNPIGGPVTDPYVPLIASTEFQSSELAFEALRTMLDENAFTIWVDRILRLDGSGKAVSVSAAPSARDGARTTFQVADETHRLILPRQVEAWRVMLANTVKRKAADPWSLEVTTSFAPGGGSVAESTHEYARMVEAGKASDDALFYFYRYASDDHDITTADGLRAAIVEASGPVAEWSDIEGIAGLYGDPTTDASMFERLWLNRIVRSSERAFDAAAWKELANDYKIPDGAMVALGFDGAQRRDSTALVAVEASTGHAELLGLWERPPHAPHDWKVDVQAVSAAVADAFERYDVWRGYFDPYLWQSPIAAWANKYGDDRVLEWHTNLWKPVSFAVAALAEAIDGGHISHDGNPDLTRHVGNAYRRETRIRDDQDRPLYAITKERPDSPHKIDAAMALVLAWQGARDATSSGAGRGGYYADGGRLIAI